MKFLQNTLLLAMGLCYIGCATTVEYEVRHRVLRLDHLLPGALRHCPASSAVVARRPGDKVVISFLDRMQPQNTNTENCVLRTYARANYAQIIATWGLSDSDPALIEDTIVALMKGLGRIDLKESEIKAAYRAVTFAQIAAWGLEDMRKGEAWPLPIMEMAFADNPKVRDVYFVSMNHPDEPAIEAFSHVVRIMELGLI